MTKTRNRKILTIILSLLFSVSLFIGFGAMKAFNASAERGYWEEEYEEEMTTPYWNRDIIYNEIALPFIDSSGFVVANLMYTPLDVVAVKDQTLGITYVEGKDYTVDEHNKRLIIPMRTSDIPVIATDADTNPDTVPAGYHEVNNFNGVFVGYYVFDSDGDGNYGTGNQVVYTESSLFYSKYLSITYTYNRTEVDRAAMTRYDVTKLTNVRAKLEAGKDINMLVLGDSITTGCSTTGSYLSDGAASAYFKEDMLPGTPGYADQVANELEKIYGVNVNLTNLAVGGALSDFSLVQWDKYNGRNGGYNDFLNALNARTYDLCIIAFGMNDAGSSAMHDVCKDSANPTNDITWPVEAFYSRNIRALIQTIKGEMDISATGDKVDGKWQYYNGSLRKENIGVGRSPNCDFILINSYPRNTEYDSWGGASGANSPANASNNFKKFKVELQNNIDLYAKGSIVVDMYKVADSLLKTNLGVSNTNGNKRYCELSSTNFNHPNDWMHRIYAMNVVSALYDYSDENFPLLYKATQHDEAGTNFTYTNEIYDYAYGKNGWAQYKQQMATANTHGTVYVDKNYDVDIHHTYGYANRIDYGNVNQFNIQNSGWLINYLGYDVEKTIEFRFHVTAAGYVDSLFGNTVTGRTSYGFAFSSSVLDALKTANNMYDTANKNNLAKISLWGSNCDTTDFGFPINLFGRLWNPQTGGTLGANNGESSFYKYATEAERTAANPGIADEGFMTVRINIGKTNTTVSLVKRYIVSNDSEVGNIPYYKEDVLRTITIDSVTRADFPTGFAYMSFAVIDLDGKDSTKSTGSAVVSIEDTRFEPHLYNSTEGKAFPSNRLTDGWAVITNSSNGYFLNQNGSYTNYMQEPIIRSGFGNFGFSPNSKGTIHSSGTHWNLRAFDVTEPININYTYTHNTNDPAIAQGWYAIQLWDNIETMLSDNLSWHDKYSLSKIHITGGNYVNKGIADYANGINFFPNNASYPRFSNTVSTAWGYNYGNLGWEGMLINLHIVIGETSTTITVNNNPNYIVTLPLKQSDFAFGKAYLSLSVSNAQANAGKQFYVKMWNLDRGGYITDASGNAFRPAPDVNGWDTYVQNTSVTWQGLLGNTKVNSHYGVASIHSDLRPGANGGVDGKYGYSEIWMINNGTIVNHKPLDIHQAVELTYKITAPSVTSNQVSWYAISFFDNLEDALLAGNAVWDHRQANNTGAKLTILSGNGNIYSNFSGNTAIKNRGSFDKILLVNPYVDDLMMTHNNGFQNGLQWSNDVDLRIYIDDNKTRIFDVVSGGTHTINNLTWDDFSDGKMYAAITMGPSIDNPVTTMMAFNIRLRQKYIPNYTPNGYDKHNIHYGYTFEDGGFDAEMSTNDIYDGTTGFITKGSYVINKNKFDVTKEFEFKINVGSGGWANVQHGAWMVGMFERRQYMHEVGEEIWDVVTHGDKVKVLFGGSSAQANGLVPDTNTPDLHADLRGTIYPKTKTINTKDTITNLQSGFNYYGSTVDANGVETFNFVTVYVYIPSKDHIDQGYIKADGKLILAGADMGITQEDFASDRVFLSFYGYGLTRWKVKVTQHEPTVVTSSVNLGTDISTNYLVKLGTRFKDPVVDYSFETSYPYSGTLTPTMQGGKYVYKFDQLNAMHMTVGVDVTIKATNIASGQQEVLYEVEDYSMRDYAEGLLAKTTYAKNPKLVTLLVDFLNYGAEAQKMNYAKAVSEGVSTDKAAAMYRTSDLANKNLTDAQKAYATAYVAQTDTKTSTTDANSVRGWQRSIWCDEKTGVYLRFNVNKELTAEQIQIKVYVDDVLQTTVDGANFVNDGKTGSGHKIYKIKHSVSASMFDSKVKFEVWTNVDGAGFVKSSVYYNTSINDWIASEVGQTAGKVDFAKALWSFGQSSKAYSNMLAGL